MTRGNLLTIRMDGLFPRLPLHILIGIFPINQDAFKLETMRCIPARTEALAGKRLIAKAEE